MGSLYAHFNYPVKTLPTFVLHSALLVFKFATMAYVVDYLVWLKKPKIHFDGGQREPRIAYDSEVTRGRRSLKD